MGRVITTEEWLSSSLKVLECRVYRGPHLYSHTPMIRIQVDLGMMEDWPTHKLPHFSDKLIEQLPDLAQHTCSTGKIGGFVSRLYEGTWIGHVIEHVAIELQTMAGIAVTRGKTRSVKGKPGHYNIMYAYRFEEAGLYAGRMALDLVSSLLPSTFNTFYNVSKVYDLEEEETFDIAKGIAKIRQLVQKEKLGPTTQALVEEAERRNIPWFRLDNQSLVQLGTGRYRKIIRASITSNTSNIAVETACDKELTKNLLSGAGIPVPIGSTVRTPEEAIEAAEEIGYPVTIKPLDGNHGRGVTTEIRFVEDISVAFAKAKEHSNYIIVEKHYSGNDYRVLVVNGEIVAVAERAPAHVIGNGMDNIATLIGKVNADPRRGIGHENFMTRIEINDTVKNWLERKNLTLESVPAPKQRVVLTPTANLSTGGTAIDRTDQIHPDNATIARRAALIIGLDIAGIDMILPNISQSWRETGGGIVEVNASPGFRMHLHPSEGQPRDVAKPLLAALYLPGAKTRVPVVAVTGTNGKSTTVRMVKHILRQAGLHVGFTSTSGIFVDNECIWHGDASGPKSARLLLQDPTIDIAIIETARGGILREGLGVSDCDIGVVLNVTGDHLGLGGIETVEDMAAVKSVVTESVVSEGISVLNADDPQTRAIARYAGGSLCYFSMAAEKTPLLQEHLKNNGMAVVREMLNDDAQIVLYKEGKRTPIIAVNSIPGTCAGSAVFNVENALATVAIASALNIDTQTICMALSNFTSSFEQNPGRFNIYDGHGFRVIMDYAHNTAALQSFFTLIKHMRSNYRRVIGNLSVPGDRRDDDIRDAGRIACSALDIAVFPELPCNRGRAEGEIHRLLTEGAATIDAKDKIIYVSHEKESVEACLRCAHPGDLVILLTGEPEETWQQILAFKPAISKLPLLQPVHTITGERVAHV